MAEWESLVCWLLGPFHAVQEQALVSRINDRVNALGHHRRRAGKGGRNKLGNSNQAVADQGGIDDKFCAVRHRGGIVATSRIPVP